MRLDIFWTRLRLPVTRLDSFLPRLRTAESRRSILLNLLDRKGLEAVI
jgi:hypothetical protein